MPMLTFSLEVSCSSPRFPPTGGAEYGKPCSTPWIICSGPVNPDTQKPQGVLVDVEAIGRGFHLVNLPGSPGVVHQCSQHNTFLTLTPGEPLQEDPGGNTPQIEAYRRGQLAHYNRGALLHGYFPTWFKGHLHTYARFPMSRQQ